MDHPARSHQPRHTCCPCASLLEAAADGVSRRGFLGLGAALGGVALSGLTWSKLAAAEAELPSPPPRKPLVVKPLLVYQTYTRKPQRSWRSWGGIQTQEDAEEELVRIQGELKKLQQQADFPVKFLPVSPIRGSDLSGVQDAQSADALLVYAAAGDLNAIAKLKKDTIFFIRHKSGPLYLHYEIISPRFLRQHTDSLATQPIDHGDVVVDSQEEILWRLRSLCGLKNTLGEKILCIGGPGAWAQPKDVVPRLVREKWNMDLVTVPYADLGKLIQDARKDQAAMALAKRRADAYLKLPGTTLETDRQFVDNAMLLDQIFRKIMAEADAKAITVLGCMGTIMPLAETSACLALSTLNDDGYQAFCESDFVVIPSGVLMGGISGKPMFLNDPTYPHDQIITLAHCTGPRKMDGKTLEPARIVTHFESDYGASPKVEMRKGQKVTNIVPDFKLQRYVGLLGEIVDAPFLPICRSQIDIRFEVPSQVVAERMPGFHWMTGYGDYHREIGYALKRVGIQWEFLG
jgi:hypothetical protein